MMKTIDGDDIDSVLNCKHDENNNEDNTLAVVNEICSENEDQVSKDMHSAYASGLITKGVKEALVKLQKAL